MEILRIAASANNIYAHPGMRILGGWLVGGSGDSSALIYDALTAAGVDKIYLKALTNTTSPQLVFPTPFMFNLGLSVTLAGTGAVLYLMVE